MRALLNRTLLVLVFIGFLPRAQAFSMLGAFDTWMTTEVGYQLADPGGPMNLGEEYRWNMPLVTYGFDEAFLNYFGSRGVEEVEKAVQIMNDLPKMSELSEELTEFPLETRRFNYRANALFLYDLRSWALASLLETLGVGPAERYVWTLRARDAGPPIVYSVIKRNFDPVTFEPSSYVNGALYTYQILQTYTTPTYEAVEFEVDPSVPSVTSVSALNLWGGTVLASGLAATFSPGMFYTGLTRDDVGALRYIYRPANFNVESLLTNVVQAPVGTEQGNYVLGRTGGGSQNPWGAPPGTTNVAGGTNLPAVNIALRAGVDKVSFVRVDYDSLVGAWLPLTNVFVDRYVSNFVQRSQTVQRTLPSPDVLFTAADLGVVAAIPLVYGKAMAFTTQDGLNGTTVLSGPGLVFPPAVITFGKLGEYLINSPGGGQTDGIFGFLWGSYDGTTDEPVIYPNGGSIKNFERLILTSTVTDVTQNPWLDPAPVTTATGGGGTGTGTGGGFGTGGAGGGGDGGGGTTP